jgi:hypothetical protein
LLSLIGYLNLGSQYPVQLLRNTNISVLKNGEVISNIFHEHKHDVKAGEKPHFEELTEIDVPGKKNHEQIANNDGIETVSKVKRNVSRKQKCR